MELVAAALRRASRSALASGRSLRGDSSAGDRERGREPALLDGSEEARRLFLAPEPWDGFAQHDPAAGREEGGVLGHELAAHRALQDDGEAPELAPAAERGDAGETLDVERREGLGGSRSLAAARGDHGSVSQRWSLVDFVD